MARLMLLARLFICLLSCGQFTLQVELLCEVANVKVENADGRTQMFEMKKLESAKGEACTLCSHPTVNSAPQLTTLPSRLVLSVANKELSPLCDPSRYDLPAGLCTFNSDTSVCHQHDGETCSHTTEELAEEIVYKDMVPMATGDENIDKTLAQGIVLINLGNHIAAIRQFDSILKERPNTVVAYYGRGVAYSRRGLQDRHNAEKAIQDFTEVLERNSKHVQAYERRAEAYIAQAQYSDALADLGQAVELDPKSKGQFARGVVNLVLEDFVEAEKDFKKNLENSETDDVPTLFYLGLSQYYRGKVRNAIEVFKEVLKKDADHLDACTSLAQAFREVGNLRSARAKFNQSLALNPSHVLTLQLHGDLLYHSGEPTPALQNFKTCLKEDRSNLKCEYMTALSSVAKGNFYDGVKAATKMMVHNTPVMKASPEFLKAHYLREYARYLHSNLDQPVESLTVDTDLQDEFRDNWVKLQPFEFKTSYKEQPGIQPHIQDVSRFNLADYPRSVQNLICKADKIGWMMQVNTDGFTPNRRLNLAMGLSSIHIAQLYEARWRGLRQNKPFESAHSWRDLYNVAVQYRRLVDPEQPVFWLDLMPDHKNKEGYKTDITFVRGSVHNIKTMPYFDLVFKLVKTMLEHYSAKSEGGTGKTTRTTSKEEIDNAKTCEDLLQVTKKHQSNQNGFVVSTQVPSTRKRTDKDRLEGAMMVLTDDIHKQILFAINIASTQTRTHEYHLELDYIYNQLQDEIRRAGASKVAEMDSVINIILSMAYYFYNLMPLTRGSSVVAYSVAIGLIMSVGRQVTGKIPTGKLLEMEAMLAGAPDAFIMVTKQWMTIKRLSSPTSGLPKVWETFPTVRSVLEVLSVGTEGC